MTRRQAIRDAAVSALDAAATGSIPDVDRRVGPFSPGALPAIGLRTARELVTPATNKRGPAVVRAMQLGFLCYAAGDEDELEPLLNHVTKTLVGNRLGGLVHTIEEMGTEWLASGETDQDYRKAVVTLLVTYGTAGGDQEDGYPSVP